MSALAQTMSTGKPSSSEAYSQKYFIYGTLMDPTRLCTVLDLEEGAETSPCNFVGISAQALGTLPCTNT